MSQPSDDTQGFQCPQCGKRLRASGDLSGKRVKCPKCGNNFKMPGQAAATPPAVTTQAAIDDDWLSLDTPAITDVDRRKQEAAAVQAERDAQKEAARVRQSKLAPPPAATPPRRPGAAGPTPTADGRTPQSALPKAGRDAVPKGPTKPADDEFQLAPLNTSSAPPASPKSAGRPASVFDDDLPELAELATPPVPRRTVKPLLELELEDLDSPSGPAKPPGGTTRGGRQAARGTPPLPSTMKPLLDELAETPKDYRVTCSVCGTAQYVPLAAKGMKIKCPDCHSSFRAPAPSESKRPKPTIELSGEEFPLVPTQDQWQKAEVDAQRSRTNAMLQRAQRELTEDEVESLYDGDFDTAGFIQRSMGLLFDPVAVALMIGYGVVFALVFAVAQFGIINSDSGQGRGTLLLITTVAPLVGVLFGMPMLSSALALLESVANRQPRVQEWPGFNVFDHFGDLLAILAALLLSALPGGLLGFLLFGEEYGVGRVRLIMAMISTYFLFPIILLSILDNGSLARPISESVLRSIKPAAEAWGAYYLKTLLLFGTAAVAWLMLLGPTKPPGVVAIAGFLISPLVYFTFQQLGALADAISEHLSFEFVPTSKEATEDAEQED